MPGVESLPAVAPVALLGVAALLGGLSLLLGLLAALRGGARRAPAELWNGPAPGLCVRSPDGLDVPERWHAFDHAVVGFLPLSLALHWWWHRRAARHS